MSCGAQREIGELIKETVRDFNTVPCRVNVGQISFHQLINSDGTPQTPATPADEAKPVNGWNPTLPSHQ